jgi:hypothetical protein
MTLAGKQKSPAGKQGEETTISDTPWPRLGSAAARDADDDDCPGDIVVRPHPSALFAGLLHRQDCLQTAEVEDRCR